MNQNQTRGEKAQPRAPSLDVDAMRRRVDALLKVGELDLALREVDRAWRTYSDQSADLRPLLGHLLLQTGSETPAAIKLLAGALEQSPDPDTEADLVLALLAASHPMSALNRLRAALMSHACPPDSRLASAARALLQAQGHALKGWVAIEPDLSFCCEAYAGAGPVHFELLSADGRRLLQRLVAPRRDGLARWRVKLPQPDQAQFVRVLVDGQPVLAGERILPLSFGLRARSNAQGRQVELQARLNWCPGLELQLELSDENGRRRRIRTRQGQALLASDRLGLGSRIEIGARLPDGRYELFADSPLLFKPALKQALTALQPAPQRRRRESALRAVDVVVPVYQGHEETLACIDSICRTVAGVASDIVVVDDASPDHALVADLEALAAAGRIRLLRNAENLGFSGSINRAMALHPERDAVIVNADALVFGDWLERLRAAVYREADIASVTPFSDDDSYTRYADAKSGDAAALTPAQLDALTARVNRGQGQEVPVGVGFCMYIRRQAWQEVGGFDAATFGKGYGEECDWCMRARARGWRHYFAADVFVHHAGGLSFGDRRLTLLHRAGRLLNLRHPGYDREIAQWRKADPLLVYRRALDSARLLQQQAPVVLLLTLALPGGVDRYVRERARQLRSEGRLPLILRPFRGEAGRVVLQCQEPRLNHLRFDIAEELPLLRQLLKRLPLESVELHHFLGLDAKVVNMALALGRPYSVFLHDYSWICPRITLMDGQQRYCGEPALRQCEACVREHGSDLKEEISVARLRARSSRWLGAAASVQAPSQDTAQRMRRYFPGTAIEVRQLESELQAPIALPLPSRKTLKVALLGAIGVHKGYEVLMRCARLAARQGLNLEFVVIGYSEDDPPLMKTGKVFVTGAYGDPEMPALLRRENPDLIWLPSVWPETWCYTLTHALRSGLPVVSFDIGAIAERLRQLGLGYLLPLDTKPAQIIQQLESIAAQSRQSRRSLQQQQIEAKPL